MKNRTIAIDDKNWKVLKQLLLDSNLSNMNDLMSLILTHIKKEDIKDVSKRE